MTPDVEGGRHYREGSEAATMWKCPACDAENLGPLEAGCPVCGSGKPGERLPPPPTPVDVVLTPTGEAAVDIAFRAWRQHDPLYPATDTGLYIYLAFKAGYEAALGRVQTQAVSPLTGTAESRTIVAALKLFRDQILSQTPEEVVSGEWLTLDQTNQLIARLERTDA